jgi:hypothetical protein
LAAARKPSAAQRIYFRLFWIAGDRNPFMRAGAIARTGAEITYVRFTCVAPLSMR